MERVKYIISFTINTGIPLCCSATLEHALTFCSSSEPADDTIFLTFYLVFTVCFFDNLIADIILESVFLCVLTGVTFQVSVLTGVTFQVSVLTGVTFQVSAFYTSTHIT